MSISRIANNISAINARRNRDKTGQAIQKSIERLSSGLRINRAGDDAAGLSVANRLKTQVQGLNQAVTNAADGINLINVAEGALEETTNRLNRIRSLAVQAANTAVNDVTARQAMQDEVFQSIDEITRIANTTQFGNNFLLNGDFSIQSGTIAGQEYIGLRIDASPVASTLDNGKAFLNIVKTRDGRSQIIAGDAPGSQQIINTGIKNASDIAVSMARFSTDGGLTGTAAVAADDLVESVFNGVTIQGSDVFVFEGVLADGVTRFTGTLSLAAATGTNAFGDGTEATATTTTLLGAINFAIDSAEKALFGETDASKVPSAYRTTVQFGTGDNAGRLLLVSDGNFINQSSISLTLVRNGNIVTQSSGVTRSGEIGKDSALTGVGQIGNSITAITGSTFGTGQFNIEVQDVQAAQQRKVESTIAFRDTNGAVLDRTASLVSGTGGKNIVLNGTFVGGVYTGGTTMQDGDTITLTGTNADGTTFQGIFTFSTDADVDTTLNDFKFNNISGLISELNYRTRDYGDSATPGDPLHDLDGTQSRFEDALFTFTSSGTLLLVDDLARSNSQLNFTLTFNNDAANANDYTFQDDAALVQEGFAESATFRIAGGEEVRAEAGQVITLTAEKSTREGVPQASVTFRLGSGFTAGVDKLETSAQEFVGSLNGGQKVTFQNGNQDVVFVDGNTGGKNGVAKFVTVDFDDIIDVTKRTDGLPDTGRTIILSTVNRSLNFQVGAYANQNFQASIGDLTAENLGFGRGSGRTVSDINITTLEGANDAIRIIDEALNQVNKTRSILGAATNRLEATISNLSVSAENLTASESRIRDVDLAKESTDFTKNQLLIQAGTSILAQANFQGQGFLSLIG